jgi:hypothetical protein
LAKRGRRPAFRTPRVCCVVPNNLPTLGLTAYDLAYAEKAEQDSAIEAKVFNCKQRETSFAMPSFCSLSEGFIGAHQNTLENAPVIVVTWVLLSSRTFRELIIWLATYRTVIAGLHYPIAAAAACGFWSFTRIFYMILYGTGEPKKVHSFHFRSQPGL